MVTRYSMLDQHDALYQTAREYPGGLVALARDMGKSVNVLRNKLRPAITTHHTTFEEVSRVIELCVEQQGPHCFRALHAFNYRHGYAAFPCVTAQVVEDEEMARIVARVLRDMGTVATQVLSSQEDNHITHAEMEVIEEAFLTAMGTLGAWRDHMRRRHAADNKKAEGCV